MTINSIKGCKFWVKVTPRSHKDECLSFEENVLKIRLRALPIKGDANTALIDFLALVLEKPKTKISLCKGKTSRLKEVFVQDLSLFEIKEKIVSSITKKSKN